MYKLNDNTIIYPAGVNPVAIENILTEGIKPKKLDNNYNNLVQEDDILCTRDIENSKVQSGISFIIEDHSNDLFKKEKIFNPKELVCIKDYIPEENIKGILISEDLLDEDLEKLEYINPEEKDCKKIIAQTERVSNYLNSKGKIHCKYDDFSYELSRAEKGFKLLEKLHKNSEKKELEEDFRELKESLNMAIGIDIHRCFEKILEKDSINLLDIIEYLNNKSLRLPVYTLESRKIGKGTR